MIALPSLWTSLLSKCKSNRWSRTREDTGLAPTACCQTPRYFLWFSEFFSWKSLRSQSDIRLCYLVNKKRKKKKSYSLPEFCHWWCGIFGDGPVGSIASSVKFNTVLCWKGTPRVRDSSPHCRGGEFYISVKFKTSVLNQKSSERGFAKFTSCCTYKETKERKKGINIQKIKQFYKIRNY